MTTRTTLPARTCSFQSSSESESKPFVVAAGFAVGGAAACVCDADAVHIVDLLCVMLSFVLVVFDLVFVDLLVFAVVCC